MCCRVVQFIGPSHQPDMCQAACTEQHLFFYVRVCPSHSHTTKPGPKRKRRLDLKMDLSTAHNQHHIQKLLTLHRAQLEVSATPYSALAFDSVRHSPVLLACGLHLHSSEASIVRAGFYRSASCDSGPSVLSSGVVAVQHLTPWCAGSMLRSLITPGRLSVHCNCGHILLGESKGLVWLTLG